MYLVDHFKFKKVLQIAMNYLVQFAILLIVVAALDDLQEGDDCVTLEGEEGKCKLILECTHALKSIKKKNQPKICGFDHQNPIVCCPLSSLKKTQTVKPGDLSILNCRKYLKYVDIIQRILIPSTFRSMQVQHISGGRITEKNQYPHMVLIGFEEDQEISWDCGGSLISENFILTAAHCLQSRDKGEAKKIKLGAWGRYDIGNDIEIVPILQHFPHPNYSYPSFYHDIALIEIPKISFRSNIRPACLQYKFEIDSEDPVAVGWGRTGYTENESVDLLHVHLSFYNNSACNKYFESITRFDRLKHGILEDIMICAGSSDYKKDTCQGDSGGPLQIQPLENTHRIVGIISFGKACGTSDTPGVYTRVSAYIDWIESIVWKE